MNQASPPNHHQAGTDTQLFSGLLAGDEQLWQVEDLGPPRFMPGSALLLGGDLLLELREQCGIVGSGVLGCQLRAAYPLVSQAAAAFDAVEQEDQLIRVTQRPNLGRFQRNLAGCSGSSGGGCSGSSGGGCNGSGGGWNSIKMALAANLGQLGRD